jgi:two-component system, OmpR family, sensor histidine kinase KdpD
VSIVEEVTDEPRKIPTQATWSREAALAAFVLAVSTLIALALRPHVAATNLAMVYLVGVVIVAMQCSRRISVAMSLLSVAAFDFFCVPPYLTLRVSDYEYVITFAAMLAAALVISTQTARIRTQAAEAIAREARTETLYRLSRRLAGQASVFELTRVAAEYAEEVLGGHVVIFLPQDGRIDFRRRSSDRLPVAKAEETAAQWAFEHGERAGCGTQITPGAAALYLPLKGVKETVGIMGVVTNGRGPMASQQLQLLDVLASQTAMAIERTRSQHAAEAARMQMETEQMRSSLLSAVSHDLRTPLSSITGAASTLRAQGDKLEAETRQELLESIADEAERLSRLVSNLLDMTRLESGVELRRDFYPLEEIVGAALQRMERQLERRPVTTSLPDSIPLVYADDVLLGQLVINLLENAIKYSPKGSPIEVAAQAQDDAVILEVRDRGPGFALDEITRIFAKFYRGKADGARGVGLGLAICRAITEAHEGTIEALNRPGGGAIVRIRLPVRKLP